MLTQILVASWCNIVLAVLAAAMAGVALLRRRAARRRFKEYDDGTRCVGCDSVQVTTRNGRVACSACGYSMALADLRRQQIGEDELKQASSLARVKRERWRHIEERDEE